MIAVIDYGINDTYELAKALDSLKVDYKITRSEKDILDSDRVIISNSNSIKKAIKRIHLFNLFSILRMQQKPILGIAHGMELLCEKTEEGISCLGLIPTDTKTHAHQEIKWLSVNQTSHSPLFKDIPDGSKFYFECSDHIGVVDTTIATSGPDDKYSAAIVKDQFYGVQFIPEKSGELGFQILKNFVNEC